MNSWMDGWWIINKILLLMSLSVRWGMLAVGKISNATECEIGKSSPVMVPGGFSKFPGCSRNWMHEHSYEQWAGPPGALVNIDGIAKPACLWQEGDILSVEGSFNKIITPNINISTQTFLAASGFELVQTIWIEQSRMVCKTNNIKKYFAWRTGQRSPARLQFHWTLQGDTLWCLHNCVIYFLSGGTVV